MKQIDKHNIDYVKRLAKKLAKEKNIPHHEALDVISKERNYNNWKHFYNENKNHNAFTDLSVIPLVELDGLYLNGFSYKSEKFDPKIFSETKKIKKIRTEIKKYFTKTKSFNSIRTSYGLKHDLERHIGEYVANGELIYAMYLEGYKIKKNNSSLNCSFNFSSVGLKNLVSSNKLLESLNTSWEYQLEDYQRLHKKFKKYKYHFNLIIKLLVGNEVPKKNIYGIIGAEIGETSETIKQWFSIENVSSELIPEEKLKSLSKIFGFKPENVKN
ncbi:MAG: hypothetical protein P1U44_04455 [Vicingaceae bacterium]|jgi:hypothetical protein|nr:hypothetical protein [Vicingaceae bacterium]